MSDFLDGFTLPDCPQVDEWHFFQAESHEQKIRSDKCAEKRVAALELLVVALNHSAWHQPFKDRAARLRDELESDLSADEVAAATAHAQSRSLEEMVAEILDTEKNT